MLAEEDCSAKWMTALPDSRKTPVAPEAAWVISRSRNIMLVADLITIFEIYAGYVGRAIV